MTKNRSTNINSLGGVSFETDRRMYRGTVTVLGIRYRTNRHSTRLAARRALNKLIKDVYRNLAIT